MQFTIFALASLIALAIASPIAMPAAAEDVVVREAVAGDSAPAMSDPSGNVVTFDPTTVVLPLAAAGQ